MNLSDNHDLFSIFWGPEHSGFAHNVSVRTFAIKILAKNMFSMSTLSVSLFTDVHMLNSVLQEKCRLLLH